MSEEPEQQEVQPSEEELKAQQVEEEKKKIKDILKGGLQRLGKTADNKSLAYTTLDVQEKEISSLFDFLKNYPNLRYINLNQNTITDVSDLVSIPYLLQLNAQSNQIDNLNFLTKSEHLRHLQFINLTGNKITRVPEINLVNLRKLVLNENIIETCEDFKGHNKLEILELQKNQLKNLKGLTSMENLQYLNVSENQIENFSDLSDLKSLTTLQMRSNLIKNLDFEMPNLPSLFSLNLEANKIEKFDEITSLKKIVSLRQFTMKENPCSDEAGDNAKKEIIMIFQQITIAQDEKVTEEERKEAFDLKLEREQKLRDEEEARKAEEEAKRLEEEAAKANGEGQPAEE